MRRQDYYSFPRRRTEAWCSQERPPRADDATSTAAPSIPFLAERGALGAWGTPKRPGRLRAALQDAAAAAHHRTGTAVAGLLLQVLVLLLRLANWLLVMLGRGAPTG